MGSKASTDILSNLSNLLPTGTFLTFQALVPLFSNNGDCGLPEKVMTGLLILFFTVLCFLSQFVDSVTTESGKIYYGIVTTKGLFNPQFRTSSIAGDLISDDDYFTGGKDYKKDFKLRSSDFFNGFLNIVAFLTLSCLTPPVTTCFYPGIPTTVVKTAPILVAMVVGIFFAFGPAARHGLGNALTSSTGMGFVQEHNVASQKGDESKDQLSKLPKGPPGAGNIELAGNHDKLPPV